ncbi:MAG: 2-oxoacid:acceptor oxidoreductase subunit alpha [Candidatus Hydrothermales bacterium]
MKEDVQVRIAGIAGDGSFITGEVLASALKKIGFFVVTIRDFPSNIRGLPSNYTVRGSSKPVYGRKDFDDFQIAFDLQSLKNHLSDLKEGSVVIYDSPKLEELKSEIRKDGIYYVSLPLREIARKEMGVELIKNMVAFGVLAEILGINDEIINLVVYENFKKKGEKFIELNKKAILRGRELIRNNEKKFPDFKLKILKDENRVLAMGNDLVSMGAIAGGCRFLAAYPITPASEVLEFLARELKKFGGVTVQAEDEIASINMAIGASIAGLRALVSSSGPGIALKTEGLSYAGMTETPLVIYYAMRVGPSTGLPTKTSQEDMLYIIFGGHGEFPRVVLMPGTPEELFYLTAEAFNLAEEFQIPVIILTDQFLAQNKFTIDKHKLNPQKVEIRRGKLLLDGDNIPKKDGFFLRYKIEEDGISPRIIPGTEGGVFGTTGYEHDEAGYGTEDEENRIKMVNKRMTKIKSISKKVPPPALYEKKESKYGIISAGSTFGPVLETIERFEGEGINISFLRIVTLWPFPEEEVRKFVEDKEKVFIVEQNYKGQLRFLVENAIIDVHKNKIRGITKYSGKAFRPLEIENKIREEIK